MAVDRNFPETAAGMYPGPVIRFTKVQDVDLAERDDRLERAVRILRDSGLSRQQQVADALAVLDPAPPSAAVRVRNVAAELLHRSSASPEERALGTFLRRMSNDMEPGETLTPGGHLESLVEALENLR